MNPRIKQIILKSLIVVECIYMVISFPGIFILALIFPDVGEFFVAISPFFYGSFIVIGVLMVVLMHAWGGIEAPPTKADKFLVGFTDFEQVQHYLRYNLTRNGYSELPSTSFETGQANTFVCPGKKMWESNFFFLIYVKEWTNESIEHLEAHIQEQEALYYNSSVVTDSLSLTVMICVNHVTPAFYKFVDANARQSFKVKRLPVGISFGGKTLYVAKQKDGFAILAFKKMRKEFCKLMQVSERDIVAE